MTVRMRVFIDRVRAGTLTHEHGDQFKFDYCAEWLSSKKTFSLSPQLPLRRDPLQTAESHSRSVAQFFSNLLPEGQGLDAASSLYQVSKSNLAGLLIHLGRDMAGAIRIEVDAPSADSTNTHRPLGKTVRALPRSEISERIRNRPHEPFAVWDGKLRMSVAGYQDKIVVFEHEGAWSFCDDAEISSNAILKPEPVTNNLAGLTGNEFMCMKLSLAVGLPTAEVRLEHVPEPVLNVRRFDRITSEDGSRVQRLHVIDGCQALGLPSGMKYERPYGGTRDVKDIRDGASLPMLFDCLRRSPAPAVQRRELLRWVIFQVLIGNTDAHAKNVSFFCGPDGLRLAPAYDLVCASAFAEPNLEDEYAMSIGDAFSQGDLTAIEWAEFACRCGLPQRFVASELKRMCQRVSTHLDDTSQLAIAEGVSPHIVEAVKRSVVAMCESQAMLAESVASIDPELLGGPPGASPGPARQRQR